VFEFDQLLELLDNVVGAEGLSLESLTFDQLAEVLTEAGIDASQLSELDIDTLASFVDSTTVELPDGTKITDSNQYNLGAGLLGVGGAALGYNAKAKLSKGRQNQQKDQTELV
jgi:hypothetical protein